MGEHKDIPAVHLANYKKAMRSKKMKSAIKAFCLECVGWAKEEVRLCTSPACPLHPYRVYKEASQTSGLAAGSTK